MRIFLTFLIFMMMAFPIAAQTAEEEEFVPEGPRGRWSIDQAQPRALSFIRGEVLHTDIEREDDHVYYEYLIEQPDGSIFEVEINASNGELYEIEVEKLVPGARLPRGIIERAVAEEVARKYALEKARGSFKSKVRDFQVKAHNRDLVYDVTIDKSLRSYSVIIDAFDGDVIDMTEIE